MNRRTALQAAIAGVAGAMGWKAAKADSRPAFESDFIMVSDHKYYVRLPGANAKEAMDFPLVPKMGEMVAGRPVSLRWASFDQQQGMWMVCVF